MARINIKEIKRIEKPNARKQETVEASFSIVNTIDGDFFQIDTYGRNTRVETGTVSQTIQFDKQSAKQLIKILLSEFNLLN